MGEKVRGGGEGADPLFFLPLTSRAGRWLQRWGCSGDGACHMERRRSRQRPGHLGPPSFFAPGLEGVRG